MQNSSPLWISYVVFVYDESTYIDKREYEKRDVIMRAS